MKLFVAGLPGDFDHTDLKEMFQLYGEVSEAKVVEDRNTGKSRGFGFITMPDKMQALEAMSLFKNAKIKGKQIIVKEAEEQPANTSRNSYTRRR